MKNKQMLTVALLCGASLSMSAHAHHPSAYWVDSQGEYVRTSSGECLRTSAWTPEKAEASCEGEVKQVMEMADADKDGVADDKDQCPGSAAGVSVDAKGCAKDSDNDGVADNRDKCPGTKAGTSVDANGCEKDRDNDGVADSKDQCPGTASGIRVDAQGCDVNKDSDNDGIADANDKCAGTAPGVAVNKQGCELKADIKLDNVKFKTATAELSNESLSILDNIAQTLKENDHLNFEVAGHTDNTGDYNYNVNLSEKRANAVRQYLVDKGVAADRLTARGYGPDKPVASNDTRTGRSQNRRVELVLQ